MTLIGDNTIGNLEESPEVMVKLRNKQVLLVEKVVTELESFKREKLESLCEKFCNQINCGNKLPSLYAKNENRHDRREKMLLGFNKFI